MADQDWLDRFRGVADMFAPQERAAKMAGVSKTQFQRYLYGRNDPPFSVVMRFIVAAGRSLDWLAFGVERAPSPPINE